MSDRRPTEHRTADRKLGLDTDHVTERQTGQRVDGADRTGSESAEDAAAEACDAVAAVEAGGTAVDDDAGDPSVEGPNSA